MAEPDPGREKKPKQSRGGGVEGFPTRGRGGGGGGGRFDRGGGGGGRRGGGGRGGGGRGRDGRHRDNRSSAAPLGPKDDAKLFEGNISSGITKIQFTAS